MIERKYINTDFGPIPLPSKPIEGSRSEYILNAKRAMQQAWARGEEYTPAE